MMVAHLEDVHGRGLVSGLVELAYNDPGKRSVNRAELLPGDDLDAIADRAVELNAGGSNVYIGAGLRHLDTDPTRRAGDADVIVCRALWADLDKKGAAEAAADLCRDAPACLTVITGTKPTLRTQVYWLTEEAVDLAELAARNDAIADKLGGDAISNPSRVLRLAGCIAHPVKAGREAELVTLINNHVEPYENGALDRAFPALAAPVERPEDQGPRRTLQDIHDLLKTAQAGEWHNPVRDAIASLIGHGLSDDAIRLAVAAYCDHGPYDSELRPLIDGARAKFGRPEQHQQAPAVEIVTKAEFIAAATPPRYAVAGIRLQRGYLYSLTGLTNAGKSTVCVRLALAKVAGAEFSGLPTAPEPVLYMFAENPDDGRQKVKLQGLHGGLADVPGLDLIAYPFDLAAAMPALEARARQVGGYSVVIVDTVPAFALALGMDEENNNLQQVSVARTLRSLTGLFGNPAVLAPTHPVKGAARDNLIPRGGGAFVNEVDGNYTLWSEDDGSTTELHWQGKFRGAAFDPVLFRMPLIEDDIRDADTGVAIPNVIALPMSDKEADQHQEETRTMSDALLEVIALNPDEPQRKWAVFLGWTKKEPGPDGKLRPMTGKVSKYMRALERKGLYRDGHLTQHGRKRAAWLKGGGGEP